jgi:multiple sugar transport system permease protein
MRPAAKSLERSDARFALGIVAGLVLFNVIIIILPLIYAAWISFHDRDVILRTEEFIGFDHYRRILTSPEAIAAILLSIKFTAMVVAVSLLTGLGIALVLNEEFNENTALYWVAIAFVWHITPLAALFFLAALQTVPDSLYQAARIDRAPALKRFLHVTLPHLRPTVLIVLVVVTVEAFRSFDLLFAMTRGGPGTASQTFPMLIFRYTFEFSRYGLAAAASYILAAISMIITTICFFVLSRRRHLVKIAAAPVGAEARPEVASARAAIPS